MGTSQEIPLIELRDVTKDYVTVPVCLKKINLTIHTG